MASSSSLSILGAKCTPGAGWMVGCIGAVANSSSSNLASSNGHSPAALSPLVADAMVTDVLYASLKSGMTSDCVTGRCLLQIIQLSTAREYAAFRDRKNVRSRGCSPWVQ